MDIQEQIKELTEKFSNLFEVDGIGGNGNDDNKPSIPEIDSLNSLNNNKKNTQESQPKGKRKNLNLNFKEIFDKIMGKDKNTNDKNINI